MSEPVQVQVEDARRHNFTIIDNEIVDNLNLSVNAKAAYLVLVRSANRNTGECWLTADTLGKKMGTGRNGQSTAEKTARQAVAELVSAGLIAVQKRQGHSSIFRIVDVPKDVTKKATPVMMTEVPRSFRPTNPGHDDRHNKRVSNKSFLEQEKPSSPKAATVPGFAEYVELVKQHCESIGQKFQPLKAFFKNLQTLILAKKDLTPETLKQWLANRAASDNINPADEPHFWISTIGKYAGGPLDRFGLPPQKTAVSKSQQRHERNDEKYRRLLSSTMPAYALEGHANDPTPEEIALLKSSLAKLG